MNNVAPLVGAALGFDAGRRRRLRAVGSSFAGNAVGYLWLFLGTYAVNAAVLEAAQAELSVALLAANAVGVGGTGALFAVVAARYT